MAYQSAAVPDRPQGRGRDGGAGRVGDTRLLANPLASSDDVEDLAAARCTACATAP
ncbi:hypothetical protein ACLB9X_14465 [Streptomyces sp. 5K101]|uniref:hypothetical protein n=1 Tax=Streptomyces sp. 5K101 TaxID=3390037 RepID=UPI00397504DF